MMPEYVNRVRGRDGVNRYYYRRPGFQNRRLPDLTDPAFAAEYAAAEARAEPLMIGASRNHPGSVSAVIAAYLASTAFTTNRRKRGKARAEETKKKERYSLERFREIVGPSGSRIGDRLLINLRREHLQAILDTMAGTPAVARDILKALAALMRFARVTGVIKIDPTVDVVPPPMKESEGYLT
jgi:hypothetical protein